VVRNVHAVTDMHVQGERALSTHQRAVELGTARLGRPASLYVILAIVLLWAVGNDLARRAGMTPPDPPPFSFLQGVIGLAALLTATMVLITQNRQAKLIERRMHLDLQVNLLTEQKAAKLIELLEELRRDLPNVRNRTDLEAETMQQATEPLQVMAALDERAIEAEREARAHGAELVAAAEPGPTPAQAPAVDATGNGPRPR
jgi:uncharacterized membrane protein